MTVLAGRSSAQVQPALQVASPADGTLVNPGQAVNVIISSPAGVVISNIVLVAEDPIGTTDPVTSVPAQFSVTIPPTISPGRYFVKGVGVTDSGQAVQSDPIDLDVERPDVPVSLSAQFPTLTLEALTKAGPMSLLATFADGSVVDISRSSYVSYQSTDTSIVTVDSSGIATGIAKGHASLTITYSSPGGSKQLSVPVIVSSAAVTPSSATLDFGNTNVGTRSMLSLRLTNTSVADNELTIKAISMAGNYTETDDCVSMTALPVGSSCNVEVTFLPRSAGPNIGTLTILNSLTAEATVIPLTGNGIASQPSIRVLSPMVTGPIGTHVTVQGGNFGAVQGSSVVLIGGVPVTPTTWTDTSVDHRSALSVGWHKFDGTSFELFAVSTYDGPYRPRVGRLQFDVRANSVIGT